MSETDGKAKRLEGNGFPHMSRFGPSVTIENVEYLIKHSNVSVRFDVIRKRTVLRRDGKPCSDLEIVSLAAQYGLKGPYLEAFIGEVGRRNPLNPVNDWIDSMPWDGTDRLSDFYGTITTVEGYPVDLMKALVYRWLLSAVAAAMLEGKRFSTRGVLTLQGAQGIGKTSWISRLVSDPELRDSVIKRDHHMDAGSKDAILGAIRHWIVEVGELDGAFKRDIARLKGFLTNDCDKVRPPYGKTEIEYDRRTVFAATVNDDAFLVDPTGNSRFYTIAVESLDYNHDVDMQQLFAQLAVDLRKGVQWWLTQAEEQALAEYNLRHRSINVIAERVKDKVDMEAVGKGEYRTASEVLIEIGIANPSNSQCRDCGATLRELLGPPSRVQGREKWRVPFVGDYKAPRDPSGLPRVAPEDEF